MKKDKPPPESPECLRIGEYLYQSAREGKILTDVQVISGRYTKKPLPGLVDLKQRLPLEVQAGGVHGKFIFLLFSDGSSLHNTLGMSGFWTDQKTKHTRVEFDFSGSKIYYTDMRNFGTLKWTPNQSELKEKIKSLGPSIMHKDFPPNDVVARFRKRDRWNICKALMDQSIIAGVGNYLKSEVLYACRVNPNSSVEDLEDEKLVEICMTVSEMAWTSYKLGGATIQSYRNPDGSEGEYSRRFSVYAQKYDPEGNEVQRISTPDGRTTHWVPSIQVL